MAWFDILDREGKIDTSLTAETRTQLLNKMIPKLSIDKRSLSNTHKRAYVAYYDKLERLIKRL